MKDIYIVGVGDSMESIAQLHSMRPSDILEYNHISASNVLPGVILVINNQEGIRHVVKPMETIDKLGAKYGVPPAKIRLHNNIKEVFLGQIVFIPVE